MAELQTLILRLYSKVTMKSDMLPGNATMVISDPLSQLREIESQLLLMFETRDYIENVASQQNPEVYKRFLEAEKTAEKNRKQIRYEKKRRQEMDLLLSRQQKVEKRT